MVHEPEAFRSVSDVKGTFVADNGSLRCMAVQLNGDDLCLYNPVKQLVPTSSLALQEAGQVKYLLSPNHYHHLALREHSDNMPKAVLCASTAALPRLRKVTGLKFANLSGLMRKLPEYLQVIEAPGLKTGELWLRVESESGICWLVGDAFCGPEIKKKNVFSATPEILKPFPKYGVGNRVTYIEWVKNQIEKDQPTTVIPCHGAMLRGKHLPKKLMGLISKYI